MKRTLFVFALCLLSLSIATSGGNTKIVTTTPVISTTAVDSCRTVIGSTTLRAPAASFASVTAGMRFVGTGIPPMSRVISKTNDSTLVISAAPTVTDSVNANYGAATLRFGYYTSAAYQSGDALGFPDSLTFRLDYPAKQCFLQAVFVVDLAAQATNFDIQPFSARFTATTDNAAWNPSDADAVNERLRVSITNWYSDGTANKCGDATQLAYPVQITTSGGYSTVTIFYNLIAKGAPTFASVADLKIIWYFFYE